MRTTSASSHHPAHAKTVDELKSSICRPVSTSRSSLINVNFTITLPHEHWNFRSKVGMTASMTRPDHHAHRHSRRTELDSPVKTKDNDGYTPSARVFDQKSIASPSRSSAISRPPVAREKFVREFTTEGARTSKAICHRYGSRRTTRYVIGVSKGKVSRPGEEA